MANGYPIRWNCHIDSQRLMGGDQELALSFSQRGFITQVEHDLLGGTVLATSIPLKAEGGM